MNISTAHILQCDQSEPLAGASGRILDLMNENVDKFNCKDRGLNSHVKALF